MLASILAFASTQATVGRGAMLLGFYAAGLGTPFLATALAFSRLTGTWAWFKRNATLVNGVAGGLLAIMGVLLLTDQMKYLSGFVLRLIPGVARFG